MLNEETAVSLNANRPPPISGGMGSCDLLGRADEGATQNHSPAQRGAAKTALR